MLEGASTGVYCMTTVEGFCGGNDMWGVNDAHSRECVLGMVSGSGGGGGGIVGGGVVVVVAENWLQQPKGGSDDEGEDV